jgi:hypothetical protein
MAAGLPGRTAPLPRATESCRPSCGSAACPPDDIKAPGAQNVPPRDHPARAGLMSVTEASTEM